MSDSATSTATSAIYALMRCRNTSVSDKKIMLRDIAHTAAQCVGELETQDARQKAHDVRGAH